MIFRGWQTSHLNNTAIQRYNPFIRFDFRPLIPAEAAVMKRTVLVVDDRLEEAQSLLASLEQEGVAVVFACSGADALRYIEAELPDAVVCDLEMPDMSGYDMLEAIGNNPRTRQLPFLLTNAEWTIQNWSRPAGGRTAECHLPRACA